MDLTGTYSKMKKENTYIVFITSFILGAIFFQILPLFASYVPSQISTITNNATTTVSNPFIYAGGSSGQLLYFTGSSTAPLATVPNAYAVSSPNGGYEINEGAYPFYPNPSGMLNTYDESAAGNPVLSASFMGSTTSYVQVFGQNLNPQGSMDMVFSDDKGNATSSTHYIDLGIASSKQVDTQYTALNPLYGYLFNQGSPLIIGTGIATSTIISEGMTSTSSTITFDQYGHIITHGSTPGTPSGCGTSPTISGNDNNGTITLGTGLSVTACTMAFAHAFPTGSSVTCSVTSNSGLSSANLTSVSTTGFTAGLSLSLGGGKLYYQCQASQ